MFVKKKIIAHKIRENIWMIIIFSFLGMFSWFPIFFPLRNPVKLKKGDDVELHFWRLNNGKQVWYEWCITKPVAVPIHNPNGRSYTIGL